MVTIGILEDNTSLRQTMEDYLIVTGKFQVVFSEGNFNSLAKRKFATSPDIVLLDIHLPDVNGIDVISNIKRMFPDTYVVIVTGDKEKDYILKAIEKGACGYLYKPFDLSDLNTVLRAVQETGSYLEPDVITTLCSLINQRSNRKTLEEKIRFTPREREILELLKKGHTYNEMAKALNLSFHTINHHIKNIYAKTDVKSKSELIVKFFRSNNN